MVWTKEENMGENNEVVNQTTQTNDDSTSQGEAVAEPTKLTFDELLKDPEYQAEFDRKVAKSTEKAKAKWQKEAEKQRSEAEALAKMSEEEKHQHEINKLEAERKQAVSELNAYRLKDEAQKIANEKGLDISLLDLIDYSSASAEDVKTKIDEIDSAFSKAVEKEVNERLKQPKPKQFSGPSSIDPNQDFLDKKYKNNPYYKKK